MILVNGHEQPTTNPMFWAGYTNLSDLPGTTVPIAASADGLPITVQIAGPVFADPVCLRFARWLKNKCHAFVPPRLP
jgi:amidase